MENGCRFVCTTTGIRLRGIPEAIFILWISNQLIRPEIINSKNSREAATTARAGKVGQATAVGWHLAAKETMAFLQKHISLILSIDLDICFNHFSAAFSVMLNLMCLAIKAG